MSDCRDGTVLDAVGRLRGTCGWRFLLLGTLVGHAISAGAVAVHAADLEYSQPNDLAYDWTGPYAGAFLGFGWGDAPSTVGVTEPPPGPLELFNENIPVDGTFAGLKAGYNVQTGNFVFGIEADASTNTIKGSGTSIVNNVAPLNPAFGPVRTNMTAKFDRVATLRARAGIGVDRLHIYGTAGAAFGTISHDVSATWTNPAYNTRFSGEDNRVGWAAGGGFEFAAEETLRFGLEYLYMDMGTLSATAGTAPTYAARTRLDAHTVRFTATAALGLDSVDPAIDPTIPEAGRRAVAEIRTLVASGPADVANQLYRDSTAADPLFETDEVARSLSDWYRFKSYVDRVHGLQFGMSYNALLQHATASRPGPGNSGGPVTAAGGVFDIFGTWTVLDRDGPNQGTLGFRVADYHPYTNLAPEGLGGNIGSIWGTTLTFGDLRLVPVELWWEQRLVGENLIVRVGKVDMSGIFDTLSLGSTYDGFSSTVFNFSTGIAFSGESFGVVGAAQPIDDVWIVAGIIDANGNERSFGVDRFINQNEYFKAVEAQWVPDFEFGDGAYNVTLWEVDRKVAAGTPKGNGFSMTFEQRMGNVRPFFRYSRSYGGAAALQQVVAGGFGVHEPLGRRSDVIGVGAAWGKPSDSALRDQTLLEAYYRVQVTPEFSFTPDVQLIFNPASNPNENTIAVFGARGRIAM